MHRYFDIKSEVGMKFESMSDQAVAEELGRRIEQMRLERNLTQQTVADEIGLSRVSYARIESGQAKLLNVIAVLRVFGQLSVLEQAFPQSTFSPMEQLKLQGHQRQRATGNRGASRTFDEQTKEQELDW
jgi:putative transcriptional regulator